MKFAAVVSLLAVVPALAQDDSNVFNCDTDAAPCIAVTTECIGDGMVRYCSVPTGAPGCKTFWSHQNWYSDFDIPTPADRETCAARNNGCDVGDFAGNDGVKLGQTGTLCVEVPAGRPVLLATKDRSQCGGNNALGWTCRDTCVCSGGGACTTEPPIEFCDGNPGGPSPTPQMEGDPHVKAWSGKWFDYMGECDLKMISAPRFDGEKDMTINVRTTIQFDYSYIEAAAIQIGEDVLEVGSYGDCAVNGVDSPYLGGKAGRIGGYELVHTEVSKKKHTYDIILGPNENITLASYKNLVSVKLNVDKDMEKFFGKSEGLLGAYSGDLLARDGRTVMDDMEAFGQEWQVTDEEAMLFRTARAPQFPAKCNMPAPKAATARRLGETISHEAAEMACAHKTSAAEFNNCVYDVMAFGDLELATAGSF